MALSNKLFLLTPLSAVLTLPVGILAGLFYGLVPAIVVFVVGWLLLVPTTAILFGGQMMGGPTPDGFEQVIEEEMQAAFAGEDSTEDQIDPVEVLRQRYARGEINDAELERGLEALLETEGMDPEDAKEIEKTIDRLDDIESGDELLTETN